MASASMTAVSTDLCTLRGTRILSPGPTVASTMVMMAVLVPCTEKGIVSAERFRRQFLRPLDHAGWIVQIVQGSNVNEIQSQRILPDERLEVVVHAAAALVPGNVKLQRLPFHVVQ
ncbi:hypothetical protein GCM10025857_07960 [Alicyclobacillus contaminans]|nr:hypothetical protein GCM10025857_07960 [Alicyclobacillus contaminans]